MAWSDSDGRGEADGPNAGWNLPDGSTLSPDACWTSNERLQEFSIEERERFLPLCPDFVVEVQSQSDNTRVLEAKMHAWISNGAKLAWLIDPYQRLVTIHRPGRQPEVLELPEVVAGETPVEGFHLSTAKLWASR